VMQGYHGQPEATAAVLRDGILATGDVGHVDADGYVYITGRAKEMIIVGGENVYPREIENVLLQHPQVAEAAAIGVRDPLRGEQPVAFVILKPGGSAMDLELRAFCRERLAGYKVPRQVVIAEDLPRGPTGKILKRALAERLPAEA
jgi:long-chain acyl-CoA synthetase